MVVVLVLVLLLLLVVVVFATRGCGGGGALQPVVEVVVGATSGRRPQAGTVLRGKFGELHQMLRSANKMGDLGMDFCDTK